MESFTNQVKEAFTNYRIYTIHNSPNPVKRDSTYPYCVTVSPALAESNINDNDNLLPKVRRACVPLNPESPSNAKPLSERMLNDVRQDLTVLNALPNTHIDISGQYLSSEFEGPRHILVEDFRGNNRVATPLDSETYYLSDI